MITQRPNFVDSPYFVDDEQGWRLLPGAPKEITREFRQFMKLTENPFIAYDDQATGTSPLTLHELTARKRKTLHVK